MTASRTPSSPDELRRLVAQTEIDPAGAFAAWETIAQHCSERPYHRRWVEEVLREMFFARTVPGGKPMAVLCNVAVQLRCVALAPAFAAQLEVISLDRPTSDIRALLGAVLELAPRFADIEHVRRLGRDPDVFPVAIHLLAALDPEETTAFIRAHVRRVLTTTRHADRLEASLAALCSGSRHGPLYLDALAVLEVPEAPAAPAPAVAGGKAARTASVLRDDAGRADRIEPAAAA